MAEKRKFSDPEDIRSTLEQLEEEDVYFGGENSNTGDNVELQEVASDEEASKVTVLEKLVRCFSVNIIDLQSVENVDPIAWSVEKYVLGSGKRLEIEVEVQNEGEDAFESTFELHVPSGLNYVKIERKDDSEREIPVQCSPPSYNNNNTLHCDIGNPLPRQKLVRFLVLLQPFYQQKMNATYNFTMAINSTNPERSGTVSDNFAQISIPIWVVTELSISGSSRPVDVYYNSSQYVTDDESKITKESQIGPQVAHLYTITNKGPSEFLEAQATILWPSKTLTGEPLLYLLEEPEVSGKDIKCYVENNDYNVKNVKIERKGKSFFDAEPGTASAWHSSDFESSGSSSSSGGGSSTRTSSSSSWSSSSSSRSGGHLSREERIRFEEDERRREEEAAARETGDGSHRHVERVKASHQGKNHYSSNGGRLESDSYSSGADARERGRTDYSRVPGDGSRVREEEHRTYSSSSWSGRGSPVTRTKSSERTSTTKDGKTETKWRVEEDGVVKTGSSVVDHEGTRRGGGGGMPVVGPVERRYEMNSTRSSSSRTRGGGSGNVDRRVSWKAEDGDTGRTGGTRTAEERRSEWNTTWTSGGRPITSEHSSWRKEQDGAVVGSTEHSRTYEGEYEASRTGGSSRHETAGRRVGWRAEDNEDESALTSRRRGQGGTRTSEERRSEWSREGGGAVTVDGGTSGAVSRRRGQGDAARTRTSEEKRSEWNTTWSTGGQPVTSEHTSWRKEQDGAVIGSGEHSRTYEGEATGASRTIGHVDRSSSSGRNVNWRVEGEGMTREDSAAAAVDEGAASRRRGQGGSGGTRTSEEKRSEWNTTWSSGGRPATSEHTSWRKEQDGAVIGSGEHSRTYEGEATGASRTIGHVDRSSSSDRNVNWRVEGEGMTKEGGAVVVDDSTLEVSSRRRGHGGGAGTRTTEEKRSEWNTTWSSGSRPVTSEHTSWRKEQDGAVIGSGDHTRTYEGTAERAKAELEKRLKEQLDRRVAVASSHGTTSSVDTEIDQNLIATGGGGTTYKKEWEEHYNTTWGTSTGGKPVTVAKTKWTIEEDGNVKTGGDTKTYEGVAPGTAGTTLTFPSVSSQGQGRRQGSGVYSTSEHHESRTHGSGGLAHNAGGSLDQTETSGISEVSRSESTHTGGSGRKHHFSTESEDAEVRAGESERRTYYGGGGGRTSSSGSHHHRTATGSSERTHTHSGAEDSEQWTQGHRSEGESGRRTHSHGSASEYSGSSFTEAERRAQGHRAGESHYSSERRTHGSGSSGVASSIGESSGSSSFDVGAIARGPGDGKARTYVADLGILEGGASSGSSGSAGSHTVHFGAAGEGESRRHHTGSRERHYSFGGEDARDEGSHSYSSSAHGSGGRNAAGSSYSGEAHYASGRTYTTGSRNIEGDPDLDPDYESRKSGSSSASSHSYGRSYSSRDGAYETEGSDDDHRSISNQNDRQGFRHYRRERREADDYETYNYDEYREEEAAKKCAGPVSCTRIICKIGALKKDQEVHVAIRSRLWLATVKKIAPHVETVVGSEMTAKVTLLPTIGRPSQETMTKNSTEIKTRIMTEPQTQPDVVPLWIVVLSAVSGALILMLLVYILYKLGFFKRNRPEPSTGSEKTPLNRNGHYQGDEPL